MAVFAAVLVLGWVDYATGFELSFAVFYVGPVVAAAWLVGERLSIPIAVLSALVWQLANYLAGERLLHGWVYAWNTATRLGFFLISGGLTARLRSALSRAEALSRTDGLTGLANGRAFREAASAELVRSARYAHHVTLVCLDLDNFKDVNDRLGHAAGDTALRVVARELLRGTRRTDTAARLGGDEFALLLPETDVAVARTVVSRLHASLLSAMQSNGWLIGFSAGVLTLLRPEADVDQVIQAADRALYDAKRAGKNRIAYVETVVEAG